jgi:hypothetical protein
MCSNCGEVFYYSSDVWSNLTPSNNCNRCPEYNPYKQYGIKCKNKYCKKSKHHGKKYKCYCCKPEKKYLGRCPQVCGKYVKGFITSSSFATTTYSTETVTSSRVYNTVVADQFSGSSGVIVRNLV